ncbi:MAG: alanine--tRNA ligase [bacterium]
MTSEDIRSRFLKFFESRGHKLVPSASLVPENDPSVLFTTAGMQQFKPYYTGAKNPEADFNSKNVTTVQKCVRTGDIDEVGDDTHLTFFEMLGNFSFGGYWKKEAIAYAHEFITKELGLAIDYVSIFKDDESGIPADEESREIWKSIDSNLTVTEHKKEDNFWGPTGDEGPCGPTTEIYINGVEIWNIVFNEYYKTKEGQYTPLETKGIDTGMGLERLLVQAGAGVNNVYETDLFDPVLEILKKLSLGGEYHEQNARIVADHVRTSIMLVSDGVLPSNKDQGYILRRLIRRALVRIRPLAGSFAHEAVHASASPTGLEIEPAGSRSVFHEIIEGFFEIYKNTAYLNENKKHIKEVIFDEEIKFRKGLENGFKEIDKGTIDPFILWTTHGFPIELTMEIAKPKGIHIDLEDFNRKISEHQKLSQTASAGMFKGGLANHEPATVELHTAHHLLLAALQEIVGPSVKQRGSNITEERLRMDFVCDHKLTDEEKQKVEAWVNDKIAQGLNVVRREMPLAEAEKIGAEMEFGAKYPETVSVYFIEDKDGNHISKEFCGGPHVSNTSELGHFKILKEEAVSAGVRRIKAVLG